VGVVLESVPGRVPVAVLRADVDLEKALPEDVPGELGSSAAGDGLELLGALSRQGADAAREPFPRLVLGRVSGQAPAGKMNVFLSSHFYLPRSVPIRLVHCSHLVDYKILIELLLKSEKHFYDIVGKHHVIKQYCIWCVIEYNSSANWNRYV
jgi:hypothetical protein